MSPQSLQPSICVQVRRCAISAPSHCAISFLYLQFDLQCVCVCMIVSTLSVHRTSPPCHQYLVVVAEQVVLQYLVTVAEQVVSELVQVHNLLVNQ